MNISVKPSTIDDFEEIAALEAACFSAPWSRDDILRAVTNPAFVCVSASSGGLLGYGMMYAAVQEADIVNIAVSPAARRLGIGQAIMESLMAEATEKGCLEMYLEVRESNTPARALYEKLGFETIGKRKNYYKKPTEDAILMKASLKQ